MAGDDTLALAVRALSLLAWHPDGVVSSDRLGQLLGVNPVIVRRMLGRLRWDGLVVTRHGRGGGYALAREPELIGLGRLSRALVDGGTRTPASTLATAIAAARAAYVSELDRWTVAQVAVSLPAPA